MPNTAKVIEEEYGRRKQRRDDLQEQLDREEVERRILAVKEGRSKLLTETEAETMLTELGFYD